MTEIRLVESSLIRGWGLYADDGALLEGLFIERDDAVRADERIKIARLIGNRRDRLRSYVPEDPHDPGRSDVTWLIEAVAAGVDMAVEIALLGTCPACVGSSTESGGVCKVCGVDYVTVRAGSPNRRPKR